MIKTAMVLAAGHGTRMRPLTNDRSKAMVEVGGRPLIDHMIERLLAVGVERVVVNVHAHADHLEAHLKRYKNHCELLISNERDQLLETGGGVVKALPLLEDAPIFICNIDAVWLEYESALSGLISDWDEKHMDDLLLLAPFERAMGYNGKGDFTLADTGHLNRRVDETAPYIYAGVQIAALSPLKPYSIKPFSRNVMWTKSLEKKRAFGHVLDGFWMHVGDPQAREVAETILLERRGPRG